MNFREWLLNEIIDDSSIIEVAQSISKLLSGGTVYRGLIANMLYHALTRRFAPDITQQKYEGIKHLDQRYREGITKLKSYFDSNGYKTHFGPWFQIDTPGARKSRTMGDFKESAKAYWSIEISEENIKNFLNSLIHLAYRMYQVSQENDDAISFKLPSTLGVLNKHPDSLVVYIGNPRNRDIVEQAVEEMLSQRGVKTQERTLRAKRGFDWKKSGDFNDLDPADQRGGSHTELISHVIATQIASNAQAFAGKSPQTLAKWIKTWAEALATHSPQSIYQQFYGRQQQAPVRTDPYSRTDSVPV